MEVSEVSEGLYSATYYPASGGVVVARRGGYILDAGLIREPGDRMTERELLGWLRKWLIRGGRWTYRDVQ